MKKNPHNLIFAITFSLMLQRYCCTNIIVYFGIFQKVNTSF